MENKSGPASRWRDRRRQTLFIDARKLGHLIDRVHRELSDQQVAFYDALAANNSALEVMGKDNLKVIATELVTRVRKSVTIDWTLRESARAKDQSSG